MEYREHNSTVTYCNNNDDDDDDDDDDNNNNNNNNACSRHFSLFGGASATLTEEVFCARPNFRAFKK